MSLTKFINEERGNNRSVINESLKRVLGTLTDSTVPSTSLPVSVETSDWVTVSSPERLVKTFSFLNLDSLKYFIDEVLTYQESIQHHALLIIEDRSVRVETYTHDIEQITEQDIKLSNFCDEVANDINFIQRNRDERI